MRSLWPREHGAYAQLGVPLVVALALAPSEPGTLLAAGAICAFLANEPLVVLLGHRGKRAKAELADRAKGRLALLASLGVVAGVLGLALAPGVLPIAGLAALPALGVIVLAVRKQAHSEAGELAVALALPGAAAPVAVAGGASPTVALLAWAGWAAGFCASVAAVHRVLDKQRALVLAGAMLAAAGGAIVYGMTPLVAAVPLLGLAAVVSARPPHPRKLRAIGVAFLVAALAGGVAQGFAQEASWSSSRRASSHAESSVGHVGSPFFSASPSADGTIRAASASVFAGSHAAACASSWRS